MLPAGENRKLPDCAGIALSRDLKRDLVALVVGFGWRDILRALDRSSRLRVAVAHNHRDRDGEVHLHIHADIAAPGMFGGLLVHLCTVREEVKAIFPVREVLWLAQGHADFLALRRAERELTRGHAHGRGGVEGCG